MPALANYLNDAQVAAVVNYVRTHFDNAYRDVVSQEMVANARQWSLLAAAHGGALSDRSVLPVANCHSGARSSRGNSTRREIGEINFARASDVDAAGSLKSGRALELKRRWAGSCGWVNNTIYPCLY